MNFLRNLLASIIGGLVAFGILFLMFLVFISLVGSADDGVTIKDNTVLELRLDYPVDDYIGSGATDPFSSLFVNSQGLNQILHAIAVAEDDANILGISIDSNYLLAGMSQTHAIREALKDFRNSGKFVYAYGDFYLQKDYYLSSIADGIYLNPVGALEFKGLSSEVLFFKDLQDKSGVRMEVIRHGKYKSAVEPFLSNTMSDANRNQIQELIGSLWSTMVQGISEERNISGENLNIIADTLGGRTPEYAKATGLIDDILFRDQYVDKLREASGLDTAEDLNFVSLDEYVQHSSKTKIKTGSDKIAVIYAQGEIIYGEGGPKIIGQDIITEALIEAREDKKVKAIVLRVNSPGGSALTSDIIWREVELTKEMKPVVVSMGDVAASGGYYIAVGADKIFAEPTTITGSIGVFGVVPNITELATEIGINAEQVGTNKNSVEYSLFEPMDPTFRKTVQEGVEATYQTFLSRVAQGRGISISEADSLAQGRVWSGTDAKRLGLVDELGGLEDAVEEAASMVGLSSYGIKNFPKYKTGLEQLMEDLGGTSAKAKQTFLEEELGTELYSILKNLKSSMDQKGVQARMPFMLNIK
ncbi:MAG: signal peptide peptidase SppA [Sediminicola sp.]